MKVTESTPAEVLVTVGAAGIGGRGRVGPGAEDRECPAAAVLFTVVKSPPTNSWLPSVAIACGPRPRPRAAAAVAELVIGVQCPSEPSVSDWSSRCVTVVRVGTCGNPPGRVRAVMRVRALVQPPVDHHQRLGRAQAVVLPQQRVGAAQADREVAVEAAAAVALRRDVRDVPPITSRSPADDDVLDGRGAAGRRSVAAHGSFAPGRRIDVDPIAFCETPLNGREVTADQHP